MIYSLNEIYASGGQLPIVTLEINNSDIGTLRFVLAYEDMKLDGETYHASAFTIQQPERSDSGFSRIFRFVVFDLRCQRRMLSIYQTGIAEQSTDIDHND